MPKRILDDSADLLKTILSSQNKILDNYQNILEKDEEYTEQLKEKNDILKRINEFNKNEEDSKKIILSISEKENELRKAKNKEEKENLKKIIDGLKDRQKEINKNLSLSVQQNNLDLNNLDSLEKQTEQRELQAKAQAKLNANTKQTIKNVENLGIGLIKAYGQFAEVVIKKEAEIAKNRPSFGFSEKEYQESVKRIVGLGQQAERLRINVATLEGTFTKNYGVQTKIIESDLEHLALLVNGVGLGDENSAEFVSNMRLFGLGLEESSKMALELTNLAKQNGLDAQKVISNFQKDMKIAQNYTFKNGVNGLKDMSAYAEKMKINMSTVASLADKISTPEDAIKMAANLQVLGGSFSALSDPMELLHMGLNDMEGLTKQYSKMLDKIGTINKETGEVTVGGYDRMRLKAASQTLGVSMDEMMTTIRRKLVRQSIQADINANANLTGNNQAIDFISSVAQKRDGKWTVEIGGESKMVSELSPKDIELLKPDDVLFKDIAHNVGSITDILTAQFESAKASWGNKLIDQVLGYRQSLVTRSQEAYENKDLTIEGTMSNLTTVLKSIDGKMDILNSLLSMNILKGTSKTFKGIGSKIDKIPMTGKLGKALTNAPSMLGKGLKVGGAIGSAYSAGSIIGDFATGNKSQGIGGVIGGILGGLGGFALGGPAGAMLGFSLGQMAGSGIGGAFEPKNTFDTANDVIIPSNGGKPIKLNSEDDIIAAKPNGAIDKYFKNAEPTSEQRNLELSNRSSKLDINIPPIDINGIIKIDFGEKGNSQNINITDLLSNNYFKREITKLITNELNKNNYSGKLIGNTFNN